MKKYIQDDKLRNLFSETKIKASENLKYRIMQQIETEKALSRKNAPKTRFSLASALSIFGAIYALILLVALVVFSYGGQSAIFSNELYIPAILITFIGGVYWMISNYDDRRRKRKKE